MSSSEGKRSWLDRLLPRMKDFRALLTEQAAQTERSIEALAGMLEANELDLPALEREELSAEVLERRNRQALDGSFATPYDREDIQRLIEEMDWIVSHTMATAREMVAMTLSADDAMCELLAIVLEGVVALRRGLELLDPEPERAAEEVALSRGTDRRARTRYERALADLFATNDPIEILKRREIYHHLTDSAKRVHKAAMVLDSIRVKNV